MFNTLSWQTETKRHNYNEVVLVYKALGNLTPAYISDLLTPISQSHHRTLRSTTSGALSSSAQVKEGNVYWLIFLFCAAAMEYFARVC